MLEIITSELQLMGFVWNTRTTELFGESRTKGSTSNTIMVCVGVAGVVVGGVILL